MRVFILALLLLLAPAFAYGQGCDSNTQLLLHLDGADAATSTTDENCDASGAHTISFRGTAQLDTDITKFGASTLLLDGNSDYLDISDSTDWDMFASTADDWTVDIWLKYTNYTTSVYLVGQYEDNNNRWQLYTSLGEIRLSYRQGGTWRVDTSGGDNDNILDTNWHHIAAIIIGTGVGIYIDGTQVNYDTWGTADTFSGKVYIGARGVPDKYLQGSMDEVRIQNSNYFAVTLDTSSPYTTGNFSVPTEAYSVASGRRRMILMSKFIKIKDCSEWNKPDYSCGYDRREGG